MKRATNRTGKNTGTFKKIKLYKFIKFKLKLLRLAIGMKRNTSTRKKINQNGLNKK